MPKVKDIKVTRIDNLLKEKFGNSINMDDTKETIGSSCYFSRALAATSLMMINKIEAEDAALSITDGRDDFGIDAIYINDNQKTITLVQSKHRENGTSTISRDEILLFEEGVRKLINSDYDCMNERILKSKNNLDSALTKSDYKIILVVIYTGGELNNSLFRKLDKFVSEINGDGGEIASLRVVKLEEVYNYVVINRFEDKINIDNLMIHKLNYFNTPQDIYYGLIKASELVQIYRKYGNRIFSSNIRYFKGDTKVNDGIQEIIKTQKEYFHLYNNGVKAICKKIIRKPIYKTSYDIGSFEIEGFSIVNGAQTTGSLSKFTEEELEQVYVFITIVSLENSQIDNLSEQITTLSNTQNKIDFVDFTSLDKFHLNLKNLLKADGKDYIYVDGDVKTIDCITLYSLTNALCCFKSIELSAYIKNGYNKLFKNIKNKPYTELFEKRVTQYFAWNVSYFYEKIVDLTLSKANNVKGLQYSIPTHGFRFVANLVFDYIWKDDESFKHQYLNFEDYYQMIDIYVDEIIEKLIVILSNDEYKDKMIPNIFRSKRTVKELKSKLMMNLGNVDDMQLVKQ